MHVGLWKDKFKRRCFEIEPTELVYGKNEEEEIKII